MQLARKGESRPRTGVLSCIPEYLQYLRIPSTLSRPIPLPLPPSGFPKSTLSFYLSLLHPPNFHSLAFAARRTKDERGVSHRELSHDMNFTSRLRVKREFERERGARTKTYYRTRAKNLQEGSPNSLLQPRGRRRRREPARPDQKTSPAYGNRRRRGATVATVIRKRFMGRRESPRRFET